MSRCLVTGGAGFIGSHVTDHLLQRGHEVVVVDDLSGGFLANVPPGANFVEGNILDHALVDRLFERFRFEYVFHLAAYAAEGLSHFIKRFNYHNNLIGSVNLINASVNVGTVKAFVFTSSIAVYGAAQTPMREDVVPRPEDSYGIAKLAVEQELAASASMFGLPFIIFRPHNVYGERQNIGDRYRNVVGIFMNQALKGEPFTIFGDGQQTRAFSHIDEVAPLIATSIELPAALGQIFNIGADRPCTVNELARLVARAMGVPLRVHQVEARHEVVHAFASHDKLHDVFGLIQELPMEQGIERMAAWAKTHGARSGRAFSEIEIERGLPAVWRARLTD